MFNDIGSIVLTSKEGPACCGSAQEQERNHPLQRGDLTATKMHDGATFPLSVLDRCIQVEAMADTAVVGRNCSVPGTGTVLWMSLVFSWTSTVGVSKLGLGLLCAVGGVV
jgi:hypothetical protein